MKKNKNNPLVSIVIPSFNEEKNITECLKTLLDQTYPDIEIIVVDDGSTDRTKQIVSSFPVKLIEQSHQGPAKARNLGVKKSTGEIIVFMDSDMSFSREFIDELTRPIRVGVHKGTFSKEEYISNWENTWARCWNINQNWPKQKMIPDDYPDEGIDFRAILKSEFERVEGFNDTGYTDTWTLSEKLGYKPHSVKGAKYFHSNPDNLLEVFIQSKWVSKRDYKFGPFGKLIALFRVSLPVSTLIGIYKSFKYKEYEFLVFKIIYDLGAFLGILEMSLLGKKSK